MKTPRKRPTMVRLDMDLWQRLVSESREKDRPMAWIIRRVLREHYQQ